MKPRGINMRARQILSQAAATLAIVLLSTGFAQGDEPGLEDQVRTLCKQLRDPDVKTAVKAAKELGKFGPKAKDAAPHLIAVFQANREEVSEAATGALGRIGPAALPFVRNALQHEEMAVRVNAVWCLRAFPKETKEIVPLLTGQLQSKDDFVGLTAARALAIFDGPGLPVLYTAAKDKNPTIRARVARAMWDVEGKPKEAAAIVVEILGDEDLAARRAAIRTAIWYGPRVEAGIPQLIDCLKVESLGQDAADALARIGSAALAPVVQCLNAKDPVVRIAACRTISAMGPNRSHSYSSDDDIPVAPLKLQAAVAPLIENLKHSERQVRAQAADALRSIGADASTAEPALIGALRDREQMVRSRAALALRDIHPKSEQVVPALVAALGDDNSDVRRSAAQALGNLGMKARSASAALLPVLQDKVPSVADSAAAALGEIGGNAKEVVPALLEAGRQDRYLTRSAVLMALASYKEEAREALPFVIQMLEHERLKERAAHALKSIDPEAAKARGIQ